MKKKILVLFVVLLAVLGGCGKKDADLKQVYLDAFDKAAQSENIKMNVKSKINANIGGSAVSLDFLDAEMTFLNAQETSDVTKIQGKVAMTLDLFGQVQKTEMYMKDGYSYVDLGSAKVKTKLDTDTTDSLGFAGALKDNDAAESLKADAFVSKLKMSKDGNNFVYELKGDNPTDIKAILELFSKSMGGAAPMETDDISEFTIKFVIDSEGNFSKMDFSIKANAEEAGSKQEIEVIVTMDVSYKDVKIDFPDFSGYTEQ